MLISSSLFTWHRPSLRMISEASCIRGFEPGEPFINIHSTRTNTIVKFVYHSTLTDGEEVQGWVYRPAKSAVDKDPRITPVQIHILND